MLGREWCDALDAGGAVISRWVAILDRKGTRQCLGQRGARLGGEIMWSVIALALVAMLLFWPCTSPMASSEVPHRKETAPSSS